VYRGPGFEYFVNFAKSNSICCPRKNISGCGQLYNPVIIAKKC